MKKTNTSIYINWRGFSFERRLFALLKLPYDLLRLLFVGDCFFGHFRDDK